MRKIIGILAIAFLVSTTINAQGNKNKIGQKSEFSPEQQATLQTKRMILHFDLDKNQQKAVYNLKKKQAEERQKNVRNLKQSREKGVRLTSDERFQFQNNRLDRQLENKAKMKKILTKYQFEKWENDSKFRMKDGKKCLAKGDRKNKERGNKNNGEPRNYNINRS